MDLFCTELMGRFAVSPAKLDFGVRESVKLCYWCTDWRDRFDLFQESMTCSDKSMALSDFRSGYANLSMLAVPVHITSSWIIFYNRYVYKNTPEETGISQFVVPVQTSRRSDCDAANQHRWPARRRFPTHIHYKRNNCKTLKSNHFGASYPVILIHPWAKPDVANSAELNFMKMDFGKDVWTSSVPLDMVMWL